MNVIVKNLNKIIIDEFLVELIPKLKLERGIGEVSTIREMGTSTDNLKNGLLWLQLVDK